MTLYMLLFGGGGHAKVVSSILDACGRTIDSIFDDEWRKINWPDVLLQTYNPAFMPNKELVIAVGDNYHRKEVADRIKHSFGIAVHPTAIVDSSTCIGAGIVIGHRAIIQGGCRIGHHVIVNTGAIVEHDSILKDFVLIAPGAIICGGVSVGEYSLVGAGSVLVPGVNIGKECIIGAGSVVVHDVPDFTKVAGNPARRILN